MKQSVAIYLAGTIKKGHEVSDLLCWTDEHMTQIQEGLKDFNVSFLNPALRTDDLGDQFSVFGRDMLQVFTSHIVFVDARDRRGLGVGAEMMWAKMNGIPVVTWAPRNSHYCKDQAVILGSCVTGFIHPFVAALSDNIAENLVEGAQWIAEMMSNPSTPVKGVEYIRSAMQYYRDTQLDQDRPMQDLLEVSEALKRRMNRSLPQVIFNG